MSTSLRSRFRRTTNPTTSRRTIFSRNSDPSPPLRPPLATFDSCIEACDALAADSTRQTLPSVIHRENSVERENQRDYPSDCSVLVSPDGALLFTSSSHPNQGPDCPYPWTRENSHPSIGHDDEEYESAILTGNDLSPLGDYDSNGFSARGWDVHAASDALRSSRSVLASLASFVEELALRRKEEGANTSGLCAKFSLGLEEVRETSRVGPLLASESSLRTALETLERVCSSSAESSSERWRDACFDEYHKSPSSSLKSMDGDIGTGDNAAEFDFNSLFNKNIDSTLIQGIVPRLKSSVIKAGERANERELALEDVQSKVAEAEAVLRKQKEWSSSHWQRVKDENAKIDQIVNMQVRKQNDLMRKIRQQNDEARLEQDSSKPTVSEAELWEMVLGVGAMEDFEHTGYTPRSPRKITSTTIGDMDPEQDTTDTIQPTIPHGEEDTPYINVSNISRADVEKQSEIHELRRAALEADGLAEDSAGALLNIMSKHDTTMRSARVAAESGLLSECNAAHRCLRSLVEMERISLRERLIMFRELESAVDAIDVRKDIDNYIQVDKSTPGGMSRGGDNDDGGIAAALAVLNSHGDEPVEPNWGHIKRPSYFKSWSDGGEDEDHDDHMEPDFFEVVVKKLFDDSTPVDPGTPSGDDDGVSDQKEQHQLEDAISNLSDALSECNHQGRTSRQAILYELNNQRSVKTVLLDRRNFERLCRLFDAFLTGCGRDSFDVSNAKMLMILSQTFFYVENEDRDEDSDRTSRVYVKSEISSHKIWSDEDFWDQALYQCVAESLKKSGVLLNYIKPKDNQSTDNKQKQIKWHDLSPHEYADAAGQVHSVVFAQLGTLSHSMLELGCCVSRACSFVRRLSIRYQLPLSLRITLIQHLTQNKATLNE